MVCEQAWASRYGVQRLCRRFPRICFIVVDDGRSAVARLAAKFYGYPSKKLRVVGITGTNGKTTLTYLIESVLKRCGHEPAVIGTVNYRFKNTDRPSTNTTPGPVQLQAMLQEMVRAGVDHLAMEVSSHALDQGRTEGIRFTSAVFTNLTRDHLDYHRDLETYFQAKAKLFRHVSGGSVAVINRDDPYGRRLIALSRCKVISYGTDPAADVWAGDIAFSFSGTRFTLHIGKQALTCTIRLIGLHNVYNVLACIAWAASERLSLTSVLGALAEFEKVPGRLERVGRSRDISVFVDYAHTEDALNNVLGTLRRIARHRIIVVFGCGGDRDRGKRPKMGRVVSDLADYAVVTSDNPRWEDPRRIISEIRQGMSGRKYCVIADREKAIEKSLSLAHKGDVVLVAGKGHEQYQIIRDKILPFNDVEVVRRCLQSMSL